MASLADLAEKEVRLRHDFFVAWFTGRSDAAAMQASKAAFAPDMLRIGPDGALQDRDAVIAMIQGAEGAFAKDFAITIPVLECRMLARELVLVHYEEHQRIDGEATARRATALFSPGPDAPNGVVWQHLQETWIAP